MRNHILLLCCIVFVSVVAIGPAALAYSETAGNGTTTDCTSGYTWSAVVRGDDMTYARAWGDWYDGPDRVAYNYASSGTQYHWGSLGYSEAWSETRFDGYGEGFALYADWGDKLYTHAGCLWTGS